MAHQSVSKDSITPEDVSLNMPAHTTSTMPPATSPNSPKHTEEATEQFPELDTTEDAIQEPTNQQHHNGQDRTGLNNAEPPVQRGTEYIGYFHRPSVSLPQQTPPMMSAPVDESDPESRTINPYQEEAPYNRVNPYTYGCQPGYGYYDLSASTPGMLVPATPSNLPAQG